MHPTLQEQLAGATRLLDIAMTESGTPAPVIELLTNAKRLLKQAERASATLPALQDQALRSIGFKNKLRSGPKLDPT